MRLSSDTLQKAAGGAEHQLLERLTLARPHLQLAHSHPVLERSPALELLPRLSQLCHLQILPASAPTAPSFAFSALPNPDPQACGESFSSVGHSTGSDNSGAGGEGKGEWCDGAVKSKVYGYGVGEMLQ